jgi:hypothetical protein
VEEAPPKVTLLCRETEGPAEFTVSTTPPGCDLGRFFVEVETSHPEAACEYASGYGNNVKTLKASLLKELMLDVDDTESEE